MGRRKKDATADTVDRMYFKESTQEAIIKYNASDDPDEREILYRNEIAYPLDKLAENIINRFKYPYINLSFEALKRQVVSYLVMNLHKFNAGKGKKAYSYFSVVAKNYLILQNANGYKEEKRSVSLSDNGDTFVSIEEMLTLEAPDERAHEDTREFVRLMIRYWDTNLHRVFKKKRDIEIANAIVELFRRPDGIENFNKKAIYIMIREMTDCKTSYITKVINKMRLHTVRQLNEFHEYGIISGINLSAEVSLSDTSPLDFPFEPDDEDEEDDDDEY